ncbi:MAG: hypothetical protein KAJ46_03775 [Sedimentisphaerales bacterium]|nr:hypothetical protein [Sedimentisphaerales bacterium]
MPESHANKQPLKIPAEPAEVTIEIFAFMTAAEESKKAGGATVSIASVIEKARKKNKLRRAQRK